MPLFLVVSSMTKTIVIVHSQKQGRGGGQPPRPLQPLDDVLMLVLDKDKNNRVSFDEIKSQLDMLEQLFLNANADQNQNDEGAGYKRLIEGVKLASPTIFELLDSNADGSISKREMNVVAQFEKSLTRKEGGMKDLVRDLFKFLDMDDDEKLSAEECELGGGDHSSQLVSMASRGLLDLFPTLRKDAVELETFASKAMSTVVGLLGDKSVGSMIVDVRTILDEDGDGYVQRTEVGRYYNSVGKNFLKVTKTIKEMGPLMAMFGGMNGGGGGGGGGFKMDL
jgi:Ca2+-binding EF-hand superfamily protein